ncbi:hypothetical protein GCM10027168_52620 [Streptomyces capparidis]
MVRTLLDEGSITFHGEFHTYERLFAFARPVRRRVPLKLGAIRGPGLAGAPDVNTRLRLIHDEVMPAFARRPAPGLRGPERPGSRCESPGAHRRVRPAAPSRRTSPVPPAGGGRQEVTRS